MFPSPEDALKFLKAYDLDEARVKLLEELGRVFEAADIHVKNGDILKAVEVLTTSATHNVDHVGPVIDFLLTEIWRDLTLGILPTSDSVVSELLRFADRLDKSAMTEQEIDEVSPSHPSNLRVLHPSIPSLQCSKQSNVLVV